MVSFAASPATREVQIARVHAALCCTWHACLAKELVELCLSITQMHRMRSAFRLFTESLS